MPNTSDDIQAASFDTRPPMLDRTDYESWEQCIRMYCRGKENGVYVLQSIDEGPYQMGTTRDTLGTSNDGGVTLGIDRAHTNHDLDENEKKRFDSDIRATNIVLQGLLKDIYKLINHNIEAKAIWENVKMLLAGSEFHKLVNDMRNIKMTMSNIQLNSKFVNNMTPEWDSCGGFRHIARNYTQPKRPQNSDYFKEKMLLMHAQENGAVNPNIFQADDCDAFDLDVNDEPTAQTIFMANLSSATNVLDSDSADMGNINVIPYEQYVKHNEESVVHSDASSVQYDDYMLHKNSAYVPDESFTTTLNIYKDQNDGTSKADHSYNDRNENSKGRSEAVVSDEGIVELG
nr:integrase, catalytic region, zinc finger, CCHC-type, peptidase aspartic, catalytic [Tanacetum cinerariifolium]